MNRQEFLKKLREYWIENTIPNISDVNVKLICDLIKISKTRNMLEIWTANWFSWINFWIELEKNSWNLLSIDFSEKSHLEALDNIKKINLEKTIELILWNALDEIPKLKDDFYDFVFIDWMMRRTKDFLDLSRPKIKHWGIIIIDDVIKFRDKMTWFYEYLEDNNIEYNVLPIDIDDWVMMIVKN